jgi:hypothetical protein
MSAATLAGERYVSATKFRRDGTPVSIPVWCVGRTVPGSRFSEADSGKVKRIRHDQMPADQARLMSLELTLRLLKEALRFVQETLDNRSASETSHRGRIATRSLSVHQGASP